MMERYICLSCTRQWLFIHFHLFQSHSILAHPPAPVYSFIFHSRSMSLRHGSFPNARDENMPCSGLYSVVALALGQPNHYYLRHLNALICVCDVCVYEYASTNPQDKTFE